jgi:methylmalonyl-CoA mutase cobalamin-binding domain/chain
MYRRKLWTMRQYAGFGTAQETNYRFRQLLDAGQTGLSVAFDLPTQMGYDSDHPRAGAEVGRAGVAIDTVEDLAVVFDQIPLDEVSTSMTINATAAILLAMYTVVAEERGIPASKLRGTVQNDVLKEYVARGTYIYPLESSLRLVTDIFTFVTGNEIPFNPISVSGYHMREAGATAVQEVAFTFANAIEYLDRAVGCGLSIDTIAPRISFFFAAHNDLFEEVAKFRAARRLWASAPVGAARARSLPRLRQELSAALSHANRRLHAHGTAAVEQCGAGGNPGARVGAWRHTITPHQRVRREPPALHCGRSRCWRASQVWPERWIRWVAHTSSNLSPTR